jgi:hypothetical protein
MTATAWNQIGLLLGMAGVVMIFVWGPPQPRLEEGVGLGLEDGTPLADGRTVAEYNRDVRRLRLRHMVRSRVGLALIGIGFLCQLVATVARAT